MLAWLLRWSSLSPPSPGQAEHLWGMGPKVVKGTGSPELQAAWHAHLQLTLRLLLWPC